MCVCVCDGCVCGPVNVRPALHITRVALDAFAVTNRKDVYVLQDVQENGEESIFYLKSV